MSAYKAPKKTAVIYTPDVVDYSYTDNVVLDELARSCALEKFKDASTEVICPSKNESPGKVIKNAIGVYGENGILVVALNGEGKQWVNELDPSVLINFSDAREMQENRRATRFQGDHWGI